MTVVQLRRVTSLCLVPQPAVDELLTAARQALERAPDLALEALQLPQPLYDLRRVDVPSAHAWENWYCLELSESFSRWLAAVAADQLRHVGVSDV
jgi:hypothetical protein